MNMMIYKGVIVNKSSSSYRLNVCSLNVSDGNYLKTVTVYITRDMIKTFRAATSEYFDLAFIF